MNLALYEDPGIHIPSFAWLSIETTRQRGSIKHAKKSFIILLDGLQGDE